MIPHEVLGRLLLLFGVVAVAVGIGMLASPGFGWLFLGLMLSSLGVAEIPHEWRHRTKPQPQPIAPVIDDWE